MESAWTSTGHVVQWESMTHIKPLKDLVEPGWAQALADVEPQIHLMGDFLRSEIAAGRKYLPASRNILRAFTIPFDDIKVLIVGQDPYPTPGHPVGLSFCVAPDVKPIPRSLANIYTELTDDLGVPMPANGDLTPWTKQGVMLLNRFCGDERRRRWSPCSPTLSSSNPPIQVRCPPATDFSARNRSPAPIRR